jgi:hydrogenase maturation protein HypF
MPTYHFHIGGLVQGVGFRPYVHRLSEMMQLKGWVSNGNDGVHIEINADPQQARHFLDTILQNPPSHSQITSSSMKEVAEKHQAKLVGSAY